MDYKRYIFLICFVLFVDVLKMIKSEETRVNTKLGTIVGEAEFVEFNGDMKPIVRFLGIPYAKPPVGDLRFAKPEPYGNFTSLHNATYHRPHCIQTQISYKYIEDYEQNEDCLYLNIYIPGNYSYSTQKRAVLMYIHGGSFLVGGADVYVGDSISAFHDVIIVTINYRLNAFGFLSDGTGLLLGNFGLWDMKLAIQWVHDNIGDYGGDPTRVTLFGQSAGGAAVMYQAINPSNRGLIQRVVAQSGSIFGHWALQRKVVKTFEWYVKYVGCDNRYFQETMKCLRRKPAKDLTIPGSGFMPEFVPSVDSDFLPESPESLSKRNTEAGKAAMEFFSEIDFLNGVTSDEGHFNRLGWASSMNSLNITTDNEVNDGVPKSFLTDFYVPSILSIMYDTVPDILKRSVAFQYTDWTNDTDPILVRGQLLQFESDTAFFIPGMMSTKVHQRSNGGNTTSGQNYFYVFDHKPSFAPKPDWLEGATHLMDLPYIFGVPKPLQTKLIKDYEAVDPFVVKQEDYAFAKVMMTLWSNFAKTGNPNLPVSNDDVSIPEWPQYDLQGQSYLQITTNMSEKSVRNHFDAANVAFWEDVVPLLKDCDDNNDDVTSSASTVYLHLIFFLFSFSLCLIVKKI